MPLILLAGCLDHGGAPAGLPVDENGDPLPTLHGVVVDGAIRPLAGAEVRFLAYGVNATTDQEGRYEILRPTGTAENVLVTAFMQGFVPLTHQVQVSGHRSTKMDFVLDVDATTIPHMDVLKQRGLASCLAIAAAPGARQEVGCDDDEAYYDGEPEPALPPSIWDLNPTPGLAGVVVEVHWEASTDASRQLLARLRAPQAGGQPAEVVAETVGESPLRLEIPADMARSFPRWTAIRLYVELAPSDGMPLAADNDQAFDAFATLFYIDPAPPGYTLG
ncbi:MAG: hypothetical protein QOC71_159 [Thermoplasmata archaeon]|nr:hypothetical protein [Thermoplasmata archaeon]